MPDIVVVDSITHLTEANRGAAVLAASHGGDYAGYFAAKMGVGAVVFSDAGIGLEAAGVAGLKLLEDLAVPAAAVACSSARIGDGQDCLERGVISYANAQAAAHGLKPGQSAKEAMSRLESANLKPAPAPAQIEEAKFVAETVDGVNIVVLDSMSLVTPEDIGHVVVGASHGGLLGGKPETAVKQDAFAVLVFDAGRDIDDAGIGRLAAFDARGIAGGCVSVFSARIGDGRSMWETGVVAAINERAIALGAEIGQSAQSFARLMARAAVSERT